MKLWSAVGLIVLIIGLKILMSAVFSAFEETLLRFFEVVQLTLTKGQATLLMGTPLPY